MTDLRFLLCTFFSLGISSSVHARNGMMRGRQTPTDLTEELQVYWIRSLQDFSFPKQPTPSGSNDVPSQAPKPVSGIFHTTSHPPTLSGSKDVSSPGPTTNPSITSRVPSLAPTPKTSSNFATTYPTTDSNELQNLPAQGLITNRPSHDPSVAPSPTTTSSSSILQVTDSPLMEPSQAPTRGSNMQVPDRPLMEPTQAPTLIPSDTPSTTVPSPTLTPSLDSVASQIPLSTIHTAIDRNSIYQAPITETPSRPNLFLRNPNKKGLKGMMKGGEATGKVKGGAGKHIAQNTGNNKAEKRATKGKTRG